MENKKTKSIKWHVSILALIVFCITLIPVPQNVTKAGTITVSPVLDGENNTVTFYYENDSATNVCLAGDMNGWSATETPMTKDENGIWSITLDIPEEQNGYAYKYVVDGSWIADPLNKETVGDGFGGQNSYVKFLLVTKASAPILNSDGSITFSYKDNKASSVSVAGDMNDWNDKVTPLTKNEYGVWTTTFTPGEGTKSITYKYVVDGSWVADPLNTETVGDGFGGVNSIFYIGEPPKVEYKTIELKYVREDKDYSGWCLWTWATSNKDGQVDFTVEDGVAIARFQVGKDAKSVGFKIMKDDWAKVDYDSDRYIPVDQDMDITKVTVTSGVGDIFVVPAIDECVIDNGKIVFKYRDKDLYLESKQDELKSVKLVITAPGSSKQEEVEMNYDEKNEYFGTEYSNLVEGTYKYKFAITDKDGKTTYTDEKTVDYVKKSITVSASISDKAVDYDDNAIIEVTLGGNDGNIDSIRNIYLDLSEVGGPSEVKMDKTLLSNYKLSQTFGINSSTTAGTKTIGVKVVDINGEEVSTTATVNVKSRTMIDEYDFSFDEAIIYQLLTDRFNNGDTSNDDPNGNNYDKTAPFTYHGGDYQGIIDKIDYLKELGVNTLWISPIVENTDVSQGQDKKGGQYSYHGYWAKSFENLDLHFGDEEKLKELIDVAHDNGIKIMVDVVLNHAGYGTESIFGDMLRSESGNDVLTEASSGLPDFKTEDPVVRAQLIKWQTDWLTKLKTEKGNSIDYFRVDTVKHVDDATWKEFKTSLTNVDSDFKLIGEYYGADVNTDGAQLENGQMDALLDFGYNELATNFVKGNISEVSTALDARADKITNTYLLGQFLSSHDEDGFVTAVDGDTSDEITDEDRAMGMVAASLQLTDKGTPVIYYGEELGLSEKNSFDDGDPNRYDMNFDLLETEVGEKTYNHYKKLLSIRNEYSAVFAKGDRQTILADDDNGLTIFTRNYGDQSVLTMLNIGEEALQIEFDLEGFEGTEFEDLYSNTNYVVNEDGKLIVTVPAASEGGTLVFASEDVSFDEEIKPENPSVDVDQEGNGTTTNNNSNNSATSNQTKTSDTNISLILIISILFIASATLVVFSKKRVNSNSK